TTRSAPIERTISTFRVLQTPVTSAPYDLENCTANVPTPPAAPLIRTRCPDWIRPARRPCRAVSPARGTAAACSNETFAGFAAKYDSEAHAYSARDPRQSPNTSSPGLNRVTFRPTASTRPATSRPGGFRLGLRRPTISRRIE